MADNDDIDALRADAEEGDLRAINELASLLRRNGNIDGAENWYRVGAERDEPHSMVNLASILVNDRSDFPAAESWYQRVIASEVDALVPQALYGLGYVYDKESHTDEAEARYREVLVNEYAIEHEPQLLRWSLSALRRKLHDRGADDEAVALYRQVIETAPEPDAELLDNLGDFLAEIGRSDEAHEVYQEEIEIGDPSGIAVGLKGRGDLCMSTGHFPEALDFYRRSAASGHLDDETLSNVEASLAMASAILGPSAESEQALREAVGRSTGPASSAELVNLGTHLVGVGQFDEAEAIFQQILTSRDDHGSALLGLGSLFMATQRFDDAERVYRQASELDSDFPRDVSLLGLASALAEAGKRDEAEQVFRQTIAYGGLVTEGAAWFGLGNLLRKDGRTDEAREALASAVAVGSPEVKTIATDSIHQLDEPA